VLRFDRLVHAFGFGAASVACWQALVPRLTARPDARVAVLAALAGMGIGAINEVVEFAASRLSSTNVGGYSNTGFDLAFNTIGCAAAAMWMLRRSRRTECASGGRGERTPTVRTLGPLRRYGILNELNRSFVACPRNATADTITAAINASMTAYSTTVAPRSSRARPERSAHHTCIFVTSLVSNFSPLREPGPWERLETTPHGVYRKTSE